MKRLLPLCLLVLIPAPSVALADGCPPISCGTTSSAIPGSPLLFVRPMGMTGPLQAYDLRTGSRRFSLRAGFLSANGRTFVVSRWARGKRTAVRRFDARTGRVTRRSSLPTEWSVAGISADGSRLVAGKWKQNKTMLGVTAGALRSRVVLRGNFEVESLSPDGRRLFLIHWRGNGYRLEQLDLATGSLRETPLDEADEKMSGSPMSAVATRDGHWLLTLYLKADGTTFLHALDLETGIAHCIDLPLQGDLITVGSTALALSPDEKTLYLASPFLGRVTTIDLGELRISRDVRFARLSRAQMGITVGPSAAVTPNGRMLAFSGADSAWLYDTAFGVVRAPVRTVWEIRGLGFQPDGRHLMTVGAAGQALAFNAATGGRVG
jgi:WD40 repeat protein